MTAEQRWWVYGSAGALAALVAAIDLSRVSVSASGVAAAVLFALLVGGGIATMRMMPAVALAAAWAAGLVQIFGDVPVTVAEVPLLAVMFCAARWGSLGTVLAAAATIPAAFVAVMIAGMTGSYGAYRFGFAGVLSGGWGRSGVALVAFAALAVPWLWGLTMRFVDRAQRARRLQESAEAEAALAHEQTITAQERAAQAEELAAQAQELTAQAHEIARLRGEQNRLTRDVHDVVGHSLTVILAQAESAQFRGDDDVAVLQETMRTIAASARLSLQDVRGVLSPDSPRRTSARLEAILASVAEMNGRDTNIVHVGVARPLPPELDEVACRVLQEMLTNALKHGDSAEGLHVELAWPDEHGLADSLRIEVVNAIEQTVDTAGQRTESMPEHDGPTGLGSGIEGMRRRLASVGGRLDVRRRDSADGSTFTATAWVPVRDIGGDRAGNHGRDAHATRVPADADLTAATGVAKTTPQSGVTDVIEAATAGSPVAEVRGTGRIPEEHGGESYT